MPVFADKIGEIKCAGNFQLNDSIFKNSETKIIYLEDLTHVNSGVTDS